jgi:hypothetical protein
LVASLVVGTPYEIRLCVKPASPSTHTNA